MISHLAGSGRTFKLICKMLDSIDEWMKQDDETTVTQLVKMLGECGFSILKCTVKRARMTLGWTFHGSQFCQLIRNTNREMRMQLVKDNLHSFFDHVVWTDESTIQLDCTFLYQNVGSAPKWKTLGEAPFQSHGVGWNIKEGSHKCSVNRASYQEVLHTHL